MSLGELVEKLCIANIKLFNVCDKKADAAKNPSSYSKEEIVAIMKKDIELCKQRASLKNEIDKEIQKYVISGNFDFIEEIKDYGNK